MYGSVFQAPRNFRNVSADAVHLLRLPLWLHWYICCIVSVDKTQLMQMLVVVYLRQCSIVIVVKGVTHAFCDELCHVDGGFIPLSFEWCKVNPLPV